MNFLGVFDWITPLWSILSVNWRSIIVPQDDVWVLDELKRAGIKTRRPQFVGQDLVFDVHKRDVPQVGHLLITWGYVL